jgi:hypothetical protein
MEIARVVMIQSIPLISQIYQNVVHFRNPSGTLSDAAIASEIATNFMPKIQGFQSNFLGWQYLYIYNAETPGTPPFVYNLANSPGLSTAAYIYPTLCMKLKWQTLSGGRKSRGRFYIAGGRADWVTNAGVNATGALNGGIVLGQIVARYKLGGTGPLILGLYNERDPEPEFRHLDSATFWQYCGQQRKRQYGVGI